jgi:protein-tyrosine-phosphatase
MSAGWSWAFDTPFDWFKQNASRLGGINQNMVVMWPDRIKDKGALREQFVHVIDVMPTLLEAAGINAPEMVDGIKQAPVEGTSFLYTFDAENAKVASKHKTQYFEMMGQWALYDEGWLLSTKVNRAPWEAFNTPGYLAIWRLKYRYSTGTRFTGRDPQEKALDMVQSVLFVCMGNICRSPTAEGIFRKLVSDAGRDSEFSIDSAGTIGYHTGDQADRRMRAAATGRGYELNSLARRIAAADFDHFDWIVTMDEDNFREVSGMDPGSRARVVRMCDYCEVHDVAEVPDPYYGGEDGFQTVIDILEDACGNFLRQV